VNLGEQVDSLQACKLSAGLTDSEVDILAVGRRTVFCLKERGVGSSAASTPSASVMATGGRPGSVSTVSATEPFRVQRRLEYPVACCCVYGGDGSAIDDGGTAASAGGASAGTGGSSSSARAGDAKAGPRQRLLVASASGQLQVYSGVRLVWAARLPGGKENAPVAVSVGRFGGLAGLVVHLQHDGGVTLSYMGTDPPQSSADGLGARGKAEDPKASEAEHRRLLGIIKEAQGGSAASKCRVFARLYVGPKAEAAEAPPPAHGHDAGGGARPSSRVSGTLFVTFAGEAGQEARRVRATLVAPPCVTLSQDSWDVGTLGAGGRVSSGEDGVVAAGSGSTREATAAGSSRPVELTFTVTGRAEGMPSDLGIRAVVTYSTTTGAARVAQAAAALPLAVVCRAVPPVKLGGFRVTLDADDRRKPLADLFADVLAQPTAAAGADSQARDGGGGGGQALTLRLHCGADVTVLASGKTNRVRVQAGTFEALQLVTGELERRLRRGAAPSANPAGAAASAAGPAASATGCDVTYADDLPLGDVCSVVRDHWESRRALADGLEALNDRAYQLRLVQKRLLTRFRDRTPAELSGLDKLLSATYDQVLEDATAVEQAQEAVAAAGNRLRCAVRLFNGLLRLKFRLSDADAEALEAALPAEPHDSLEQGWEERADASLMHLLRAMTGKGRGAGGGGGGEVQGLPDSPEPLIRHIEILQAQLAKGVKPAAALMPPAGKPSA